jgi:hypothetical protein
MAASWLCGRRSSVSGEQGVVIGGLKGQGGAVELGAAMVPFFGQEVVR